MARNGSATDAHAVDDAADLWSALVEVGKVEEHGWDAELAATVKQQLSLPPGTDLADSLRTTPVSAETFLRAFLVAAKAYVDMWGDLLALMEQAGAHQGSAVAAIEYRFNDEDLKVRFDLEHFRRAQQIVAPSPFDLRDEELYPWRITECLRQADQLPQDVTRWIVAYELGDPYPTEMPTTQPRISDRQLATLAAEAWALGAACLAEVRTITSTRAWVQVRMGDEGHTSSGTPIDRLRNWESDYWLRALIRALFWLEEAEREGAPIPTDLASRLDQALDPFRNQDLSHGAITDDPLDLLDLPLWTHRAELFSNWVCTRVITALEDQHPRVHTTGDAIVFSAKGTHLATFDAFEPPLHLWTELRTPLDEPVGEGRTANIQPDIQLVVDPIDDPTSTPVVIECKQFKKPDYKVFAAAMVDYARGRPEAQVILVDHGRARESTALRRIGPEPDLLDRLRLIPSLEPAAGMACAELTTCIRQGLELDDVGVPPSGPFRTAEVRLRWTADVDLDLHVTVRRKSETTEVAYDQPGSRDEWPFVRLSKDVLHGGEERATIDAQSGAEYLIWVDAYTPGSRIAGSGAEVVLTVDGAEHTIPAPTEAGKEWHVTTLHPDLDDERSTR